MQKICTALTFFLMMGIQWVGAVEDHPRPKSKCQQFLEGCRSASLNLEPSGPASKNIDSLDSRCKACLSKCNKNALEICAKEAKANPKESASFESFNIHHLNCINVCRSFSQKRE